AGPGTNGGSFDAGEQRGGTALVALGAGCAMASGLGGGGDFLHAATDIAAKQNEPKPTRARRIAALSYLARRATASLPKPVDPWGRINGKTERREGQQKDLWIFVNPKDLPVLPPSC